MKRMQYNSVLMVLGALFLLGGRQGASQNIGPELNNLPERSEYGERSVPPLPSRPSAPPPVPPSVPSRPLVPVPPTVPPPGPPVVPPPPPKVGIGPGDLDESHYRRVVKVGPDDDLGAALLGAMDDTLIKLSAGKYELDDMVTTAEITVAGVPFEESDNDKAMIGEVEIRLVGGSAENWLLRGKTHLRGLKFVGGDHQLLVDNEVFVEFCIFEGGSDQLSFNKPGYGEVAYCRFSDAGDDALDVGSRAKVEGAFFDIHHCLFENTREDGIEFRTYRRRRAPELLVVEIHHNTFVHCGTDEAVGGDAIQIIDQLENGRASRNFLIYNNVFDGQGQTHNGVGANRRDSDAQLSSVGGDLLEEPIWVWNNTFTGFKSAGVAGGNQTWAINNVVTASKQGYVRCHVQNSLTYNVDIDLSTAAVDGGGNYFGVDPGLDPDTLTPVLGGFCIDRGLASFDVGGLEIVPEYLGAAPDLGALEYVEEKSATLPPSFRDDPLVVGDAREGVAYGGSIVGGVHEPDGDELIFSKVFGPSWLDVRTDGALAGVPLAEDLGTNSWTVQVADRDGLDTTSLQIHVRPREVVVPPPVVRPPVVPPPVVRPPVVPPPVVRPPAVERLVSAGVDQEVTAERGGVAMVTLEGSMTHATLGRPEWVLDGQVFARGLVAVVELPVGSHLITLQASADDGSLVSDQVAVVVLESAVNHPPAFLEHTIEMARARVGKDYFEPLAGDAEDADGDELFFSLVMGPDWLRLSRSGVLSGTPEARHRGYNVWIVKVEDGRGGSDMSGLIIRVQ